MARGRVVVRLADCQEGLKDVTECEREQRRTRTATRAVPLVLLSGQNKINKGKPQKRLTDGGAHAHEDVVLDGPRAVVVVNACAIVLVGVDVKHVVGQHVVGHEPAGHTLSQHLEGETVDVVEGVVRDGHLGVVGAGSVVVVHTVTAIPASIVGVGDATHGPGSGLRTDHEGCELRGKKRSHVSRQEKEDNNSVQ